MSKKEASGFAKLAKESSLYPQEKLLAVKKNNHSFFIGIPNEISLQEKRVTLTPDAVALLVNNDHEIWIETKAGEGSKFSDKQYSDAGAKIVYSAEEVYKAKAILKIEPPTLEEIDRSHPLSAVRSPPKALLSLPLHNTLLCIYSGHIQRIFL